MPNGCESEGVNEHRKELRFQKILEKRLSYQGMTRSRATTWRGLRKGKATQENVTVLLRESVEPVWQHGSAVLRCKRPGLCIVHRNGSGKEKGQRNVGEVWWKQQGHGEKAVRTSHTFQNMHPDQL